MFYSCSSGQILISSFQNIVVDGVISFSLFDSVKFHDLIKMLLFRHPKLSRDPSVLLLKEMTIPGSGHPSLVFQK